MQVQLAGMPLMSMKAMLEIPPPILAYMLLLACRVSLSNSTAPGTPNAPSQLRQLQSDSLVRAERR
jgi:hypothetical protein